jgi:hypothetical protein
MPKAPIFIVGHPRSGTTLLAAMLGAHSRLSCGPETHFFRWLVREDPVKLTDPQKWPHTGTDFICSITRTNFNTRQKSRLIDDYQINRTQVHQYLEQHPPGVPVLLASITEAYMLAQGKHRWVEKTPAHLEHLSLIRQHFPDSPILRILRDPRDIVLSLMKVPWGVSSWLEGLIYWKKLDELSASFFIKDHLSYTLRFEDLVQQPVAELRKICEFLGEEFEEGMLDTSETGKRVNSRQASWKEKASQPLDKQRIAVWHSELSDGQKLLADSFLGDRLLDYGYPLWGSYPLLAQIYPENTDMVNHEAGFEKIATRGIRFWKNRTSETPTVQIFLGDPGNGHWLPANKIHVLSTTLNLTFDILRKSLTGKQIVWITGQSERVCSGIAAAWLKWILRRYKITLSS